MLTFWVHLWSKRGCFDACQGVVFPREAEREKRRNLWSPTPSPLSLSLCLPVVAGIRSLFAPPIWSINPDHLSWCWTFLNCQIATLCFMTWKARSKLRGLLLYYQVLYYVNRFIQTYSIIVICVLFSPQKCLHVTCIVRNFLQLDASLYPIMIFLHHSLLTLSLWSIFTLTCPLLGRNCLTSKSETQLI